LHDLINVKLNVVNVKMSRQVGQTVHKLAELRLPEWRILALLADEGALSQADIRGQIGMDKGQISRTVKSMFKNELISSDAAEGKSRNIRLSLTDKGRAVHQRVDVMMERRNRDLLASLSPEQQSSLYEGLELLEKAIDNWSM
jgi:DNA-binding MarR family transcriptional regulator